MSKLGIQTRFIDSYQLILQQRQDTESRPIEMTHILVLARLEIAV